VFNQFGSKQLVLDAITARSLAAYRDLLRAALDDDATPTPALLRKLFRQMGKGIAANQSLYREVFAESFIATNQIHQNADLGAAVDV
jgi:AcrR family transcriptional regulator